MDIAYKVPKYESIKMKRMGILKLEKDSIVFQYGGDVKNFYLEDIDSFKFNKSNYFDLIFLDEKYYWYPKENINCNQLYKLIINQISLKKGIWYHVGSDILKGVYYVDIVDDDAFIEISKEGESVFTYFGDINQYVEVYGGEDIFIKNASITKVDKQSNLIKRDSYAKGSYKVGRDIPEGEYYLKCNSQTYFVISKNRIIHNDNVDYDVFISLHDGEYFRFTDGFLLDLETLPKYEFGRNFNRGMYKVGKNIPEGIYLLEVNDFTSFSISKDNYGKKPVFFNKSNQNSIISLEKGQYFKFNDGELIRIDIQSLDDGNYIQGVYKVGKDIPEGEYYISAYDWCECRVTVFDDANKKFVSYFKSGIYITLNDGDYININKGMLSKSKKDLKYVDDYYFDGMYKVGVDLPSGKYILKPCNEQLGYYRVANDSNHNSSLKIDLKYLIWEMELDLSDGQYIMIENAKMKLKK